MFTIKQGICCKPVGCNGHLVGEDERLHLERPLLGLADHHLEEVGGHRHVRLADHLGQGN